MSEERAGAPADRQQIVVSGLGGQGVLFVARLLADAAIRKGASVLTSETHGMAQRGGVVVSHLKVGDFASPLVRESRADGLLVLSAENFRLHRRFLSPSGWAVVNAPPGAISGESSRVRAVDADGLAKEYGNLHAINLVLLGYALSVPGGGQAQGPLFCSAEEVREVLRRRMEGKEKLLDASLAALALGMKHGKR
jgi:indolepyruvate ferredoxin oxidoreductase beta subunit